MAFVISVSAPKQVLLRAVGPTLTKKGIGQGDVLVDPTVELHDANHGNATNDDWGHNQNSAAIVTTGARIGATPFSAGDTKSSALLLMLDPGVYSFIASGKSGAGLRVWPHIHAVVLVLLPNGLTGVVGFLDAPVVASSTRSPQGDRRTTDTCTQKD